MRKQTPSNGWVFYAPCVVDESEYRYVLELQRFQLMSNCLAQEISVKAAVEILNSVEPVNLSQEVAPQRETVAIFREKWFCPIVYCSMRGSGGFRVEWSGRGRIQGR